MAETETKPIPVKLRPIVRKHTGKITEPWKILERLLKECECFEEIKDAAFCLFWCKDWKIDSDGIVTGAQVSKATERGRLYTERNGDKVDFEIQLPEGVWPTLDDTEKERRIFHELCHCRPAMDSSGNQKFDTKDRPLWRLRRHPIVAFHEELERYGVESVTGRSKKLAEDSERADTPLFNGLDDSGSGLSPKAFQREPIGRLGLTAKAGESLEEAGLTTLGELQAAMKKHGEFWAKNTGVHGRYRQAIEDAFHALLSQATSEAEQAEAVRETQPAEA